MRRRRWQLASSVGVAIFAVMGWTAGTWAAGAPCDCNTLIVSGAGHAAVNGTYVYDHSMQTSPFRYAWKGPEQDMIDIDLLPSFVAGNFALIGRPGGWAIVLALQDTSGEWAYFIVPGDLPYTNDRRSDCPPSTGWTGSPAPAPTVTGLGACRQGADDVDTNCLVVVPTGDAGDGEFLDTLLEVADGEDPPMAGNRPLAAIHAVGDLITGSCQIETLSGSPLCSCFVHVYVYSVDIETRPETVILMEHTMADFDPETQEYRIAIDTSELAPGYYDLHLYFTNETSKDYRIQLIPLEE